MNQRFLLENVIHNFGFCKLLKMILNDPEKYAVGLEKQDGWTQLLYTRIDHPICFMRVRKELVILVGGKQTQDFESEINFTHGENDDVVLFLNVCGYSAYSTICSEKIPPEISNEALLHLAKLIPDSFKTIVLCDTREVVALLSLSFPRQSPILILKSLVDDLCSSKWRSIERIEIPIQTFYDDTIEKFELVLMAIRKRVEDVLTYESRRRLDILEICYDLDVEHKSYLQMLELLEFLGVTSD